MSSLSRLICVTWFVAGCNAGITGPSDSVSLGVWGGDGIQMTVTATGATIEFDCDAGTITGALIADPSGKFSAAGTYSFGRGGPVEQGDPPLKAHPARYTGTTDGHAMQLTVFLSELSRTVASFQLELGRRPLLERCL